MSELIIYDPKGDLPLEPEVEWKENLLRDMGIAEATLGRIAISAQGVSFLLDRERKLTKLEIENLVELLADYSSVAEQFQDEIRSFQWKLAKKWGLE